ncbi:hypothetical protein M8J75_009799 [Diaphorina citri]|nr:hypothetical protein M8J75_009799 [Diaphorina citri]
MSEIRQKSEICVEAFPFQCEATRKETALPFHIMKTQNFSENVTRTWKMTQKAINNLPGKFISNYANYVRNATFANRNTRDSSAKFLRLKCCVLPTPPPLH